MPSDPQGGHLAAGRRGSERARTNVARSWRSPAPQPPAALPPRGSVGARHGDWMPRVRALRQARERRRPGVAPPDRPRRDRRARGGCRGSIRHPGRSRVRPPAPRPLGPAGGSVPPGRSITDVPDRVAIVGSRRCSDVGRSVAEDLGRALVSAGLAVVSGAAHGIDAAAHQGALQAGGRTVAVLGSGIDVAYPASSRELLGVAGAARW